jgi:hypothetical protein
VRADFTAVCSTGSAPAAVLTGRREHQSRRRRGRRHSGQLQLLPNVLRVVSRMRFTVGGAGRLGALTRRSETPVDAAGTEPYGISAAATPSGPSGAGAVGPTDEEPTAWAALSGRIPSRAPDALEAPSHAFFQFVVMCDWPPNSTRVKARARLLMPLGVSLVSATLVPSGRRLPAVGPYRSVGEHLPGDLSFGHKTGDARQGGPADALAAVETEKASSSREPAEQDDSGALGAPLAGLHIRAALRSVGARSGNPGARNSLSERTLAADPAVVIDVLGLHHRENRSHPGAVLYELAARSASS